MKGSRMGICHSGAGRLLVLISLVAVVAACTTTPSPLTPEQLAASAKGDRADMFQGGEPLTAPLTVSEAIARALKHNLDRRAKMREEALALNQTDLDRWDMLPKLVGNGAFTSRSEPNATRSRGLTTQTTSTSEPTYSADRDNYTADLSLSWNVLDFGVSYFTARQNADRALIATERKRKAMHTLIQEVRYAFWRAAAHQELQGEVDQAVADARTALERAKAVEQENLRAPVEALRYRKTLLETLRQLTAVQQELSTAKIELAALINLPPGMPLALAVPKELKVPAWTLTLERMEELAFLNNPDLREQGYLTRISIDDTRKAILKLLPGITLSGSRNYDHNSFLMDNHWYEAGAKLSWNLINLISGPDAIAYAETNEDVVKARRLALRMAVLAQVHISERQYHNAVSQYQQSDELFGVDKRLFELSEAKTANDAQGILERVAGRASAIASALRRFQSYAQVEQAFAKAQASVGEDLLPDNVASHDLPALSGTVARRLAAWGSPQEPAVVPTTGPRRLAAWGSAQATTAQSTAVGDVAPPAPAARLAAAEASVPPPSPVRPAAPPPVVATQPVDPVQQELERMMAHVRTLVGESGSSALRK
ncbi:MAG: TolC family protein [Magnetospirillum sp.]|nr:TolC family protein [Magnetospirillum sp.]